MRIWYLNYERNEDLWEIFMEIQTDLERLYEFKSKVRKSKMTKKLSMNKTWTQVMEIHSASLSRNVGVLTGHLLLCHFKAILP